MRGLLRNPKAFVSSTWLSQSNAPAIASCPPRDYGSRNYWHVCWLFWMDGPLIDEYERTI
jgi:hypothetical protein